MQTRPDNYKTMAWHAQQKFLSYDQDAIIRNIPLTYDKDFFYLPLLDRTSRIDRHSGDLFWSAPDGSYQFSDAPCDRLTVFDYLCDSKPDRCLTGSYLAMANFGHMFHSGLLEDGHASQLEWTIDRSPQLLHQACRHLHGTPFPKGDIGYEIPFFPDMPMVIQFWHSDEDFPPQLRYFWDKNALFYLKYETMYYALGILQSRLSVFINC